MIFLKHNACNIDSEFKRAKKEKQLLRYKCEN